MDPEVYAIQSILNILRTVNRDTQLRILAYLRLRLDADEANRLKTEPPEPAESS